MRLTRFFAVVDGVRDWIASWFVDEPPLYIDQRRIAQELRKRPHEADDDYSAKYVLEVRKRIIGGTKPASTLVQARPELLYFREALANKAQPRDERGRWARKA